jgi:hypothetical protein
MVNKVGCSWKERIGSLETVVLAVWSLVCEWRGGGVEDFWCMVVA